MQMKKFEQDLQQRINEMPNSIEPDRDLWTGIDIAITESSTQVSSRPEDDRRWFSGIRQPMFAFAMAASVVFVAVLMWANYSNVPETSIYPTSEQLVQMLEEQHQQQKQALLASYEGQSAVTNNWQEQLQELDDAAKAIKLALQNDPNNMALLKMLQQVHQQQISLIETVYEPKWQQI